MLFVIWECVREFHDINFPVGCVVIALAITLLLAASAWELFRRANEGRRW